MTWRWVRRAAAIMIGLVIVAAAGGYGWLRGSLPQANGRIEVTGLSAPAEIGRDADGIVTIRAASERDGAFALGYAHAQDRLFQMEFMRRLGAGRLSEVLGPVTLELDKRMRVYGLYARAAEGMAELSPEVRAALDSYASGVNAFLATRSGPLPLAFQMLWHEPEPWVPADSLVWGRLMALQLSSNWGSELFRLRLSKQLSPERLQALWPEREGRADSAARDVGQAVDFAALPATFEAIPGASNSWAVSGSLTASGKPLLANDPHLGLTLPNQWYLARIETPEGVVAGATAPGVPFVVIGHNGRVAWSFTTTGGDTQDLFVEKLVPGAPDRYVTPGGTSAFDTREEVIRVKGQPDVALTVRRTAHGPVISDIGMAADAAGPGEVVALAWAGLRPDDRTAQALYEMGHAADADAFREALRRFDSPQQNIVFADTAGSIGFVAAGRVPVRKALSGGGQMPARGWTGENDWIGFLPFEDLPQSLNPPSGRIITANDDITPPGYPAFIAARWDAPFRAERIAELLDEATAGGPLTVTGTAALQMDDLSIPARDLLPALLAALPGESSGIVAEAVDILRGWDFRMDRDQPAALIFTVWTQELDRLLFGAELGPLYDDFTRWSGNGAGTLLNRPAGSSEGWCALAAPDMQPHCDEAPLTALETAVAAIAGVYGDDPAAWRWGAAHHARLAHPLLDRLSVIRDLTAIEVETDGDNFTVNRGTALAAPGLRYDHVHGASLRAVFDLGDLDRSLFILPGGQSGNPLSPHFADLVTRWRDGGFLTIVGGDGGDRLTLAPVAE